MTRKIPPDAFEYYVSLGPTKSYRAVAERYDVTTRAVTKCAAREDWSERLETIEQDARERCDRKLGDAFEEARERHLKTLKAMHARALTALKQYPLSSGMDAMRAAEMVIKLERLVMGEASERHLKTLKAMHARALTALKQYPLSSGMDAMRAAEMVIKLERLVMGEASERSEMTIEEITKRELHELLIVEDDGGDDGVAEAE